MVRAAIMTGPGAIELVDDVEVETPRPGEVVVEFHWCSVCHSDLYALDGVTPPPTPTVLGHEASGVIVDIGTGVEELQVGDHVVTAMIGPCGSCRNCLAGAPMACLRSGGRGGVTRDGSTRLRWRGRRLWRGMRVGGFAERGVLRQEAVVAISPDLPLDLACVLGCAVLTGYGAVTHIAEVAPGDAVVVIGLGAVGIAAVQVARIAGAVAVIGVDPLAERRALAEKLGATTVLAPADATTAAVSDLRGQRRMAAVIDTVSNEQTITCALSMVSPRGVVVALGVTAPTLQVPVPVADLVMQQKRLLGCYLGNCVPRRDIPVLVDLWRGGDLDLGAMVTARRDPNELAAAFDDLRRGSGLRTAVATTAGRQ